MDIDGAPYLPRLVDSVVERHLRAFGAIEVAGTMWCGKTWTSRAHARSQANLDEDDVRQLAELSPETVLKGESPRVIDEWQRVPKTWDAVRRSVDGAAGRRGLYILTGSSRPKKRSTYHSGSGRISRLRMWPMSLSESGHSDSSVSLSGLFEGEFESTSARTDPENLAALICRGGWPGALNLDDEDAQLIPGQYIDALVAADDEDAPEPQSDLRRFLRALARTMGSAVTIDTLVKDMDYLADGKVTDSGRRRVKALLDYFAGRYVTDELSGWDAPIKSKQRLRTKPRFDFADPSLAANLLGTNPRALLSNMQVFGQLFEAMCLRDLRIYTSVMSQSSPDPLHYYRDADGLEVDAIIELRDGRWAAVEVKLGENKAQAAASSLLRLKQKVAANPAAQNPEPSFMMVLVGVGKFAYRTPEGIYVVPLACLGA